MGTGVLLVSTVVAVPATTASAAPAGVDIWVGYADTLRGTSANFPTPWAADPGVIFQSRPDQCHQGQNNCDSSAIRLTNNSGSPVTVNSVVVKFSTCIFDSWTHNVSVPAGGQLILADMGGAGATGCPNGGIFDGSDIGANGTVANCTPSGVIPQVQATIDGTLVTANDTGQVMNTGGVDRALCVTPNESIVWTKIGNAPCAGSALTLTPTSQTHAIGETAILTATFKNGCGDPLSGAAVQFGDLAGPNAGLVGHATTSSGGTATFSYTSTKAGTDVWQAFVQNPAGFIASNGATVTWNLVMTGRAYGLSASVLGVNVAPIPDTGPVSTSASKIVAPPCVATVTVPGPLAAARTLCAAVQTDASVPGSLALADVADAAVAIPGLPGILAVAVHSASGTQCTGSKGITTIGYLKVGSTVLINTANTPAPNTTIPLGTGKLVLNEQTPVTGGLMVNAIHLIVPGIANVVISSSTSDIHGCP
jgi:hypothetical protein